MDIELCFIHGWGLEPGFWDALAPRLSDYPQVRVNLGFYGEPAALSQGTSTTRRVLVGHSLGFLHGLTTYADWSGWIAINSFPRFLALPPSPGCASLAMLRDLRQRLQADTRASLNGFYEYIGVLPPSGEPDQARLLNGLDELRDFDADPILGALDVPGLVLASDNDPLVPIATSEALGQRAKDGGMRVHPDAGHVAPLEDPDWCAEAVTDFLKTKFKGS
jgi:pimeloyl-[acyl-carrier protein] methyl ester esterase